MEFILEDRECIVCHSGFRVMPDSPQAFCSTMCFHDFEIREKQRLKRCPTATPRKREPIRTGVTQNVDHPNTESNSAKEKPNSAKIRNTEIENAPSGAPNMIQRKNEIGRVVIDQEIETMYLSTSESTTKETDRANLEKSSLVGADETQSSALIPSSEIIKKENSNSIQLLNSSAEHLLDLAKSMATPRKDDEGEVIQKAPTHYVETSIKCLQELRGIMKTKLEYLKFAKELTT